MPIIQPEEKSITSDNYQFKSSFSKLPQDVKYSIMGIFLSTKELGQLARVNNECKTIATQCNKEYLALIKGQKIINAAKKRLKPNDVLKRLTLNDLENHYGFWL